MSTLTPEMESLKARLKATWMAGDYGYFARYLEPGALAFLERLSIAPGTRLLDVGCGAGQIAIPAARAGVRVTGVDIALNSVEQARTRAQAEGLDVRFDEGDAEMLAFEDGAFDLVVSLIGAMFAPRPERVAAELVRVCRPAGRIVMANWTAEGFVGQMFKTIGKHVPPPPLMPSPLLWGNEATVRERLRDGVAQLQLSKRLYPFDYPFAPSEVVEFYRTYYGPTNRAFATLDAAGQTALRSDLEHLWAQNNRATDGTTRYDAEYLEVVAIRATAD
ncbi:class I SAM-dependent methyltransferase [Polaromonas sp.]|uniref:class I SAM-dependent methyltransferase n=1 Tax=Polaromonas sp. TaxID=1869339 RepID=UPI002C696C8E|nr:class I SAM-dependent methyltransferase [Polaromonas sp.]HQS33503.1 class I SAM-dependent methyltransferase [Polaromonas sp.]HQS91810.1 class I SAM-dependent methyltransferase [Polaromonas sp.]